jgi:hypothetical protein
MHAAVLPNQVKVTRNASFVWYLFRSKNSIIMESADQNIANLVDLEACSANLLWPSFGTTTVRIIIVARCWYEWFQRNARRPS